MEATIGGAAKARMTAAERRVIVASSVGTAFEWYDFFLVGALAPEISRHFFSGVHPTAGFILTLLGFAAGFAIRPLGALIFGRLGDVVGRKYTFLVTISIMGATTFLIGLLPGFAVIGIAAPIGFVALRMVQGLAIGGEFGGALTYVAEHSPHGYRGRWTSWVTSTGAVALVMALVFILILRVSLGDAQFTEWGWRVPFLTSILLLAISIRVRMTLDESPTFKKMKDEGRGSSAPISEAFAQWKNLRLVLIATFGYGIGQGISWYTGYFYSLFFLVKVLKVDGMTATSLIAIAATLTIPLYYTFGAISDRIGRKATFMIGLAVGICCYFALFKVLTHYVNPSLERAQETVVVVLADPSDCSVQFNPTGTATFKTSCDIAKSSLTSAGVSYESRDAAAGSVAEIRFGEEKLVAYDGRAPAAAEKARAFDAALGQTLGRLGYAAKADPDQINWPMAVLVLVLLMSTGAITYAGIAPGLVELFPTRIRYTALSLPYHVGVGWSGGFLPASAFAITAAVGNVYAGLWYPVGIAIVSFVVCLLFLKETRDVDIFKEP